MDLIDICFQRLKEKSLFNKKHQDRLKAEIKEIKNQDFEEYFLDLFKRNIKYKENENNLLMPFLLDIVKDFNIEKDPNYEYGENPDVDLDIGNEDLREYLKNEWAPKTFGRECVANIGTYSFFGVKSTLLDMARIFGHDRNEVLAVTKNIVDKEVKGLTFDQMQEIYPELKAYCKKYPEIADAVVKISGRIRSMGTHAGGLIISNVPLNDFVPIVRDKEGNPVTAWAEGLNTQDLSTVGLVKYDLLSIANISQIALAAHLVKLRHNLSSICALPGNEDWSDTSYLNDKKSLELANRGDLKCIFQFDSPGIRRLAKEAGCNNFNDIVNITSLYRPPCLSCVKYDTSIDTAAGKKLIVDLHPKDRIAYINKKGKIAFTSKFLKSEVKKKKILKITLKSGKTIFVSKGHRFLTKEGFKKAKNLEIKDKLAII